MCRYFARETFGRPRVPRVLRRVRRSVRVRPATQAQRSRCVAAATDTGSDFSLSGCGTSRRRQRPTTNNNNNNKTTLLFFIIFFFFFYLFPFAPPFLRDANNTETVAENINNKYETMKIILCVRDYARRPLRNNFRPIYIYKRSVQKVPGIFFN